TYQEQCMRAAVSVAGYDKSDSDNFRKVMGKKLAKYIPLHRQWFTTGRKMKDIDSEGRIIDYSHEIPGGIAKGYDKKDLDDFFGLMEEFSKYAFNKSHAAAYAFLGYTTAYAAYYYPTEFMSALLNSVAGNRDKVSKYIRYCRRVLGINITSPDINTSREKFEPLKDGTIVYGLSVKNTQSTSLEGMIKERDLNGPYRNMTDFMLRTKDFMNKKTFESLIMCGAFSSFNIIKSSWLAALDDIWDGALKKVKDAEKRAIKSGKEFDFYNNFIPRLEGLLPEIKEYPTDISLKLEKEILGLYLTGNPLHEYAYSIKTISNFEMSKMDYEVDEETGAINMTDSTVVDNQKIKLICMVSDLVEMTTKKKDQMAILELEDLSGIGKAIIWPRDYSHLRRVLEKDGIYLISGYLKISSDDQPSIIIQSADNIKEIVVKRVVIDVDDKYIANSIVRVIRDNSELQGITPTYVKYAGMMVLLEKEFWTSIDLFGAYANNNNIKYTIRSW
ncbi:MAG: hypothetical protein ACRCX2_09920, partial [Paraclostridium sp.]